LETEAEASRYIKRGGRQPLMNKEVTYDDLLTL
jgi:hypothetical protein